MVCPSAFARLIVKDYGEVVAVGCAGIAVGTAVAGTATPEESNTGKVLTLPRETE